MSTTAQLPHSPAEVLAAAGRGLAGLDEVLWAAKRPEELLATKRQIEVLRSRLAALDALVCTEIDAQQAHKVEQWGSAADYLTAVSGGRHGSGSRMLRTSKALTGERVATLRALQDGAISAEHATVIVGAVDRLPVKTVLRGQAEAELLTDAKQLTSSELAAVGRSLIEVLDPDGSDRREERALRNLERAAHLSRHFAISEDGLGGVRVRGRGSVEDAAVIKAALWPLTRPNPAGGSESDHQDRDDCVRDGRDPRDYSTRLWDALVAACQHVLDTEVLPDTHGAKPRVTITIDEQSLRERAGTGLLPTGELLSASAVRILCCDADIIPLVLGSASEPLDVGRTRRIVTTAIWNALVARDRHCAFPGCRRPASACDAHHVVHWVNGGGTGLHNLALLCRTHHVAIHETGWEIRIGKDHRPEFRPPTTLDPTGLDPSGLNPTGLDATRPWLRHRTARLGPRTRGDPPDPEAA
jgi:hypothetical protein